MRDNIFERFVKDSILNSFSSPQKPILGIFFVHWAKEDNVLLLIVDISKTFAKIMKMQKYILHWIL